MTRAAFVDVDDTLNRSSGSKRVPMDVTVQGRATLFCGSRGGADDACFTAFLPKPDVLIDEVSPDAWGHASVSPE